MKIEDAIKASMARMIERRMNISAVIVTSWEEEFIRAWSEGCDTCGYGADDDSYEVHIRYVAEDIEYATYTHEGTFAELIRELDKQ
jgi:hypothetical protein